MGTGCTILFCAEHRSLSDSKLGALDTIELDQNFRDYDFEELHVALFWTELQSPGVPCHTYSASSGRDAGLTRVRRVLGS